MILKPKFTLAALFILITICAIIFAWWPINHHEFHYGQDVIITGGFYKGSVGRIMDDLAWDNYHVRIPKTGESSSRYDSDSLTIKVNADDLDPFMKEEEDDG